MNFNVLKEVNSRGGRYCACALPTAHEYQILTWQPVFAQNLFPIRAAAVQLAVSYLSYFCRFFDRIQTCQHPSTVMTDNSSPPDTPPPPRSPLPGPSGSQVQEAIIYQEPLVWQRTSYLQFVKRSLKPELLGHRVSSVSSLPSNNVGG